MNRNYVAGASVSTTFGTALEPLPPLPPETIAAVAAMVRRHTTDPTDILHMLGIEDIA